MRTEQTDRAAIVVAERIISAACNGPATNAERLAEELNIARWAGTDCDGAHFSANDLGAVVTRARWLASTERGWNVLDAAAQARAEAASAR